MNYAPCILVCAGLAASLLSVNAEVPAAGLTAWYLFNGDARDGGPAGINGTVHNAVLTTDRFGRPDCAYRFNGMDSYIEIPDNDIFSVSTTGRMSISVWMRPDTLMFPKWESTGYVHWMGKGQSGAHEWAFRMYNFTNDEDRPNRTSFYLFNPAGGLGAGSYVEEPVTIGKWMHFVAVAGTARDTITWYKNGVKRDADPIYNGDYMITPQNGVAPVRIGTRDFASYFKGAIDDLRFYNRALTADEVLALYNESAPTSIGGNAPGPQNSRAPLITIAKGKAAIRVFGPTGTNAQGRIYKYAGNGRYNLQGQSMNKVPVVTKAPGAVVTDER